MTAIKNMAYWKAKNGLSSPAKQGVIMSDEKKYGTIEEQTARNRAFAEQRKQFEKTRRKSLTPTQRAKEDSTSTANRKALHDAMKPKKEKSPGKWVQFIPMALSALGSMKKDK